MTRHRARALGPLLATVVAMAASPPASAHTFPEVRNVVVQVEPCEVVLLVGYRPRTGAPTEAILTRVASAPKSHGLEALREVLATHAMAPLSVELDGRRLTPRSVRAKIGVEPGGARPTVVLLVAFALGDGGGALSFGTTDPRSTRISWQDQRSGRVSISSAPAQGKWHAGVASFLLPVLPPTGDPACTRSTRSSASGSPPPPSAR